jgi:steroid delta-isomerase-like uncharacterized protein
LHNLHCIDQLGCRGSQWRGNLKRRQPMSDANKTSIRRLYEEAVNKGNFNVVDETLATDYVYREPTAGEKRGRAGYREIVTMYRTAFPDTKFTIEEQIAEGDKVVTRWSATATHRGELFGTPPTGKHINVQGVFVSRFERGKVVEETHIYDALGMLRQLGVVPAGVAKAA